MKTMEAIISNMRNAEDLFITYLNELGKTNRSIYMFFRNVQELSYAAEKVAAIKSAEILAANSNQCYLVVSLNKALPENHQHSVYSYLIQNVEQTSDNLKKAFDVCDSNGLDIDIFKPMNLMSESMKLEIKDGLLKRIAYGNLLDLEQCKELFGLSDETDETEDEVPVREVHIHEVLPVISSYAKNEAFKAVKDLSEEDRAKFIEKALKYTQQSFFLKKLPEGSDLHSVMFRVGEEVGDFNSFDSKTKALILISECSAAYLVKLYDCI